MHARFVMPPITVTLQARLRLEINVQWASSVEKEWTDQDLTSLHLIVCPLENVLQAIVVHLELHKATLLMYSALLVLTTMQPAQKSAQTAHQVHIVLVVQTNKIVTQVTIAPSIQTLQTLSTAIWAVNVMFTSTAQAVLASNYPVLMELGATRLASHHAKSVKRALSVAVELRKSVLTTDSVMDLDQFTPLDSCALTEPMELKLTPILVMDSMTPIIARHVQLVNSARLVESQTTVPQDTCAYKTLISTPLTLKIPMATLQMLIHVLSVITVKKVLQLLNFVLWERLRLKREE